MRNIRKYILLLVTFIGLTCAAVAQTVVSETDTVMIISDGQYLSMNGTSLATNVTNYNNKNNLWVWVRMSNGQAQIRNVANPTYYLNLATNNNGNASVKTAQSFTTSVTNPQEQDNEFTTTIYLTNRWNNNYYLTYNSGWKSSTTSKTVTIQKWNTRSIPSKVTKTISPAVHVFTGYTAAGGTPTGTQNVTVTLKKTQGTNYINMANPAQSVVKVAETEVPLADAQPVLSWKSGNSYMAYNAVSPTGKSNTYTFTLRETGASPMDLSVTVKDQYNRDSLAYIPFIDTLLCTYSVGGQQEVLPMICSRMSYRRASLTPMQSSLNQSNLTFLSAGTPQRVEYTITRQEGTVVVDALGNKVDGTEQYTVEPYRVHYNDANLTSIQFRIDYESASSGWLTAAASNNSNEIIFSVAANTYYSQRHATVTIMFHYNYNGQDVIFYVTVGITQMEYGSDATGVKFNYSGGAMGPDLNGNKDINGRQGVHTAKKVLYYAAGEQVELRPAETNFYGYVRWYDYDTDRDPQYNEGADKTTWAQKPQSANGHFGIWKTDSYKDLIEINSGAYSRGVYATNSNTHKESAWQILGNQSFDVSYLPGDESDIMDKLPKINGWSSYTSGIKGDGVHTIACDLSNYTDYIQTPNANNATSITSPTLSYRQLFELHPASEMVAKFAALRTANSSLSAADKKYLEEYEYYAPINTNVHLSTQHRFKTSRSTGDMCYFYDGVKRIGVADKAKTLVWKKNGGDHTPTYGSGTDNLVVSSTSANTTDVYTLVVTGTEIGDIYLAKFTVHYRSDCGPSKRELITDAQINRNYVMLEKIDFNFGNPAPGTTNTTYLNKPLPWEECTYGFFYSNMTSQRNTRADNDKPSWGEYALVNKIPSSSWTWANAIENHDGAANGYALYCDGTKEPGLVASISTDKQICSGQQMYCYAWVHNVAKDASDTKPIFRFDVQGRSWNDQTNSYNDWENVAIFFAGEISNDGWYQINFPLVSQKNYDESRVSIYNFATTNSGNDFMIDDICLYASQLPLTAFQASTACADPNENKVAMVVQVDYQGMTGDIGEYIYYQVYDNTTNQAIDLATAGGEYLHEKPGSEGITSYGTLHIPSGSTVPSQSQQYTSASEFIDVLERDDEDHGKFFMRVNMSGTDRWVLYLAHVLNLPNTDHDYEVRMSYTPEDINNPTCAMRTSLPVVRQSGLELNGAPLVSPSVGNCANGMYPINIEVTNVVLEQQVTADGLADWLLGIPSDSVYGNYTDADMPDHDLAYWKARADEQFLAHYGHSRGEVTDAIQDMRKDSVVVNGSKIVNPNKLVTSFSLINPSYFRNITTYNVVKDLVDNNWLDLASNEKNFYMGSDAVVRYWVFPIKGTALYTDENGVEHSLNDCDKPLWLDVRTDPSDYELNLSPIENQHKDDAQKLELPNVRVQASDNMAIPVPVNDIQNIVIEQNTTHVVNSTDPEVLANIASLGFKMAYRTDREYSSTLGYYQKGEVINFLPLSDNTHAMRAGYDYTLQVTMLDYSLQSSFNRPGGGECPIGDYFFTVTVLPDTVIWRPAAVENPEWSDDVNWHAIINGEEQDFGYVPVDGTIVLIPEDLEPDQYPSITDKSFYPMSAGYKTSNCGMIHLGSGARLLGQERLTYTQAFVDVPMQEARWLTMSAPLQSMYAGDMFIPHTGDWDTGRSLESDDPFTVGHFQGTRTYDAAYAFWLSFYNETVTVLQNQYDQVQINSARYVESNALEQPLTPGHGFQVAGYGPGEGAGSLEVRFPKPDASYQYYTKEGDESGYSVAVDRSNAGRLAFTPDVNGEMRITMGVASSSNFLFGNPTMAYIDMKSFMQDNGITGYTINGNQRYTNVNATTLAPMQSALVQLSAPMNTKTFVLKTSHLTLNPDGIGAGGASAPARTTAAEPQLLYLTAFDEEEEEFSTIILGLQPTAQAIYQPAEDLAFFASKYISMDEYGNEYEELTSPINIFSISAENLMAVDFRPSFENVPLAFLVDESYRTDSMFVCFNTSDNWNTECYLYDAVTSERQRIYNGTLLYLELPDDYQLRYYLQSVPQAVNPDVTTAVESLSEAAPESLQPATDDPTRKFFRGGNIYIRRDGRTYLPTGVRVE